MEAEVRPSTDGCRDELDESRSSQAGFRVRLDNFEGPFDLLLQLISRHKMDVTEVALSRVTDEFLDHLKAHGKDWDLDQTSQFIVVAATLLDLKAARLIPSGEVDDPEDLALLEARDLLFARLLPEVRINISPEAFAGLATKALAPKQAGVISLAHLHTPAVSVREQADL